MSDCGRCVAMSADYEVWQALHHACPVEAECCSSVSGVEITPALRMAAQSLGMSVEAFVHMAVAERLKGVTL